MVKPLRHGLVNLDRQRVVNLVGISTEGLDLPNFQSIFFTDDNTGHCIGGFSMSSASQLYKTTDTGSTWIAADFFTFHPWQLFFSDMNTGVIVGRDGNFGHGSVLITNDGGVSWSSPVFIDTNDLNLVFFTDSLTGYVVGYGGIIYKTTNGGITTVNELPSSNSTFEMYPNPAQSVLNMEISELTSFDRVTIINSQGQITQEHITSSNRLQLDISMMSTGIYFVQLQNSHSSTVRKFIKQ